MKKNISKFIVFCAFLVMQNLPILASTTTALNLMPAPREIMVINSAGFRLDDGFSTALEGHADARLSKAVTRMLRRLSGRTGLFFPQDYITAKSNPETPQMIIRASRTGDLLVGEDESYQLTITENQITLEAGTDIGALRGMETFLQLLSVDEKGYYFPAIVINDAPRFPWRGLLIDVSRHFMPVEVIKRNLDGMAAVKMNVLHWHLTDDQGFRVECQSWPKLHEMGSDGFYYTREQIKEIIAYAADRGIRIMPEFDVPAHATSWLVAYPELGSTPGPYSPERRWGIKDPTMDPTKEFTYEFLDKFFAEMAALFPDEYFHIGGDENNGSHWNANKQIQQFMQDNNIPDNHALQAHFNKRILQILTKYNKKMIGWDEIFQPTLPTDIIIHSWRGTESLVKSAQQGYMGILSNGYYIDLIQPAEYHYLNDPIPANTTMSEDEQNRILGGEATSWGELVTPETVDSRIWPRTAAIAERLWSSQSCNDVEDMYRRLEVISLRLEELGLTHIKNYDMMLRRLSNNQIITPLKTFVDVVEPVKKYERHHQGITYTSYSPYTRVVDAARPESMTARRFNQLADQFIESPTPAAAQELTDLLEIWKNNHASLKPIIAKSPILQEIETMSADLQELAVTGLVAVRAYRKHKNLSKKQIESARALLEKAKKPRGQVELMVVDSIEKLVQAAMNKNK
ncbi:MAG TPA: beta-hexosaminidase [Candidatus Marinimicrobia bacterium]|nr:beta-hexosaminidase [Candidatus Neomarinimicrobiota bacterium]